MSFLLAQPTGNILAIDWNNGSSQSINFIGAPLQAYNVSFANGVSGNSYNLQITNNASGTMHMMWSNSDIQWERYVPGVSPLPFWNTLRWTLTNTNSATDTFIFTYNGSKYIGSKE